MPVRRAAGLGRRVSVPDRWIQFLLLLVSWGAPASAAHAAESLRLRSEFPRSGGDFGAAVACIPDVDGDGAPDIAIGAPMEGPGSLPDGAGMVYVYSGADAALLYYLAPRPEAGAGRFGFAVAGSPDLDGDGRGEIIVGAPRQRIASSSETGRVYLFSGATGILIREFVPESSYAGDPCWFGHAVGSVADADQDGQPEILVGSPWERAAASYSSLHGGVVHLFSGASGQRLGRFVPPEFGFDIFYQFGYSVAGAADITGDGRGDALCGAPLAWCGGGGTQGGRAYLYAGGLNSLARLYESPSPASGGYFGAAVAAVRDFTLDGHDDVAVGAPGEGGGSLPAGAGRVYLFNARGGSSAASGPPWRTLTSPNPEAGGRFGEALAAIAGGGDLLVGAPGETSRGVARAGRVYVYDVLKSGPTRIFEPPVVATGSGFGGALSGALDFEGDGQFDLLAGLPGVTPAGTALASGETVLLKSSDGYATPALTLPPEPTPTPTPTPLPLLPEKTDLLSSTSLPFGLVTRILGDDEQDNLGESIAFGDFDGDGYDDLAVSSLFGGLGEGFGWARGDVVVLFGRRDPPLVVDLNTGGAARAGESRLGGEMDFGLFGFALAAGDVNGDGYDDLVIGAQGESPGGRSGAGTVYVVYGRTDAAGRVVSVNPDGAPAQGATCILGAAEEDWLGSALACADIDGDGDDDLILVAGGHDGPERPDAGAVYRIPGGADLPGQRIDLADPPGHYGETVILGVRETDFLGNAVAAADLDGDGRGEIIIGAPGLEYAFRPNAGGVWVIPADAGEAVGGGRRVDLAAPAAAWGITLIAGRAGDQLGTSLAAGDVNGDGRADLIVSAPTADRDGKALAGEAYIFPGGEASPHGWAGGVVDLRRGAGAQGETVIYSMLARDTLGYRVAAGDVDGDGIDDILYSRAGMEQPAPDTRGVMEILLGHRGGIGAAAGSGRIVAGSDLRVAGEQVNSSFAYALGAGGDMNRNGLPEWAVSAPLGDNPGVAGFADNNAGRAYALGDLAGAESARAAAVHRAGDAPIRGIGGRLTPALRCLVGYQGGDAASITTATLVRTPAAQAEAHPPPGAAPGLWHLETDREGWTSARVAFDFTDGELAGLDPAQLRLLRAPSAAGPWVPVAEAAFDARRLRLSATVEALGWFCFGPDLLTARVEQGANQTDPAHGVPIVFDVTFSAPVDDFAAEDVTFAGSAKVLEYSLSGAAASYGLAVHRATAGEIIPVIAAGVAHDGDGRANQAAVGIDACVTYQPAPDVALRVGGVALENGETYAAPETLQGSPDARLEIELENSGEEVLRVWGVALAPPFRLLGEPPETVDPGQAARMTAAIDTGVRGTFTAAFGFETNDPNESRVTVQLEARVVGPDLTVAREPIDFGLWDQDGTLVDDVWLAVVNSGERTLEIPETRLIGPDADAFVAEPPPTPIGSGRQSAIRVRYAPRDLGAHEAVLCILSNDYDTTEVLIAVRGETTSRPDLRVGFSPPDTPLEPGVDFELGFSYGNARPRTATGVALRLELADGLQLIPQSGGEPWVQEGEGRYLLNLKSLGQGTIHSRLVVRSAERIPAGVESYRVRLSIEDDGLNGADSRTGNNAATVDLPVAAQPDLTLRMDMLTTRVLAGYPLVVSLCAGNRGNQDATNVEVRVELPEPMTFREDLSTPGWRPAGGRGLEFALAELAAATSRTLELGLELALAAPRASEFVTLAAMATDDGANGADPVPSDNAAEARIPCAWGMGGLALVANTPSAAWAVAGPLDFDRSGTGSATLECVAGEYAVRWHSNPYWAAPEGGPVAATVDVDQVTTVAACYERLRGSIHVRVLPGETRWRLDGEGTSFEGEGERLLTDLPAGIHAFRPAPPAGYLKPYESRPVAVPGGARVNLLEIFMPAEAGPEQVEARLLRCLLGLDSPAEDLDLNGDGLIDAGDLIQCVREQDPAAPAMRR